MPWTGGRASTTKGLPVGCAFAQYIKVPVKKLSRKPDSLSHDEAAAIALVGTTAYQILFDCAKVQAGSRILVFGGATGVGAIAIQLAKAKGAWVATTCSTWTVDYVNQWKPDLAVNYNKEVPTLPSSRPPSPASSLHPLARTTPLSEQHKVLFPSNFGTLGMCLPP